MMQVFRRRIFHGVGIAFLMLTCLAATPRGGAAQDAASFISSLGVRGLQALRPSLSEAQKVAGFRQLLESNFDLAEISRFLLGTDVVVGGVSMKTTQRAEFASIIQRNGGQPDALLAVLRQQLAQSR